MLSIIPTMAIYGIDALPVTVEVQVTRGLNRQITGLPGPAIRETVDRMPDILEQVQFRMPRTRLTIHLSPGSLPKNGNGFDLPILLGILLASGQLEDLGKTAAYVFAGEVALDGSIRSIRGALCMAQKAKQLGFKGIVLPRNNSQEAALIEGIDIYAVQHVQEVIAFIRSDSALTPMIRDQSVGDWGVSPSLDYKDVIGQQGLRRAMEIAATGGHHLLMVGPPGTGKSMVAKRLPSILPPMSTEEMLETTRIYSVSHQRLDRMIHQRPFRSIHPTISDVGLTGGGPDALPGEITLAHNGVLYMDELAEFKAAALEELRQPLEDRIVTVARNKAIVQYPAAFVLIAAMNPCPCGYLHHPTRKCTCSKRAIYWYRRKISGPLLDRFDIQIQVEPVPMGEWHPQAIAESSAQIRQRVVKARLLQTIRFEKIRHVHCNAQMPDDLLSVHCALEPHARKFLLERMEKWELSARAYTKILRVARTIADLAGHEGIELAHLAEAMHYRALDQPPAIPGNSIRSTTAAIHNGHEHFF